MAEHIFVHGTSVTVGSYGVIILGPPGSGKSDLALRLLDQSGCGAGENILTSRLIADDQTLVHSRGNELIASAPEILRGRLEVRGLGIIEVPFVSEAPVDLILRLVDKEQIERMPSLAGQTTEILGVAVPEMLFDPFAPSAPARLRAAVQNLDGLFCL